MTDDLKPGLGEARNRQRTYRQIAYFFFAMTLGALIAFGADQSEDGQGNLFQGDWINLSLDPMISVLLAIGLFIGFFVLPIWGFRSSDELKREHSYISFTASSLGVVAGFPIWAALYAGGFVRAPDAFEIWIIAFAMMLLGYLYARFLR
jgi:hypothetical protein